MIATIDGIGAKQAAEHEDFGGKEHPHAELARFELLGWRIEMMRQVWIVVMIVGCGRLAHDSIRFANTSDLMVRWPSGMRDGA